MNVILYYLIVLVCSNLLAMACRWAVEALVAGVAMEVGTGATAVEGMARQGVLGVEVTAPEDSEPSTCMRPSARTGQSSLSHLLEEG